MFGNNRVDVSPLLNEAQQAQQALLTNARRLSDKWERSGLLKGLDEDHARGGMAVLLENQAGQLINEVSTTNPSGFGSAGEQWAGVALPLVRKVFGQIAAKNFVSVQPMNLPSGLIFYLDFKYINTRFGQGAGESIYGTTAGTGDLPRDGLYGAGRFGYTVNDRSLTGLTITATRTASAADTNFAITGSGLVLGLFEVSASLFVRPDLEAVRSWQPSGSVTFGDLFQAQYTRYNSSGAFGSGTVEFVGPVLGEIATVEYSEQPVDTLRGDFEDRNGDLTDIGMPEINIELNSEPIVAKTRKLKAVWSPELAQDLNAYHSVDAEAELTNILSDYIATEVDYEILDMLQKAAQTTDYWSTKIGRVWDAQAGAFVNDANISGQAWTNMTWFQTLGQKMQKLSNQIHQLTMRGPANFAVVSPTVATILETIPGFAFDTDGTKSEFAGGMAAIGSFQNRFTIYKNPYQTDNMVLMGYRGNQFLETGAVYAPYIPLIMTPLVLDPVNFTPRRGVMTRYAKKVVRPEFYAKLYIEGLDRL